MPSGSASTPPPWQRPAERLTARRFLEIDSPYGIGLTSLEGGTEARITNAEPDALALAPERDNALFRRAEAATCGRSTTCAGYVRRGFTRLR